MNIRRVTCICGAYKGMVHHAGAGNCNGTEWAESIFLIENDNCLDCNCNSNNQCEVAVGLESIKECVVYQNIQNDLYFPEYFHPNDLEKILEKKYKEEIEYREEMDNSY